MNSPERLTFAVDAEKSVSGLLLAPAEPSALYVYGHGAGAGMDHPFMSASARALADRGIATFRYNFLYMEQRRSAPDRAPTLLRTVRAAVDAAAKALPGLALLAGGKSMGGRMTSQAQAEEPLPGVRGLIFFGFPLHQPGKPSVERAAHLNQVQIPMLFLQGTRDDFAQLDLLRQVTESLGSLATLHLVDDGDHSFHVPKRSGRTDAEVIVDLATKCAGWATSF
jgi:uncharacterized protein